MTPHMLPRERRVRAELLLAGGRPRPAAIEMHRRSAHRKLDVTGRDALVTALQ
jgi:hypothetical protein